MENIIQMLFEETVLWAPKVVGVVVIVLIFLILSKIIKKAIAKGAERLKLDIYITSLLSRASRITLIIFGLITTLGTLGVDVSALVTGLGLTGFALGFALKDTIANLISGVLILLYRPFKIGDTIRISGYEGDVVSIDLRHTQLKGEGCKILMPNAKLFTEPLTVLQIRALENSEAKGEIANP